MKMDGWGWTMKNKALSCMINISSSDSQKNTFSPQYGKIIV